MGHSVCLPRSLVWRGMVRVSVCLALVPSVEDVVRGGVGVRVRVGVCLPLVPGVCQHGPPREASGCV